MLKSMFSDIYLLRWASALQGVSDRCESPLNSSVSGCSTTARINCDSNFTFMRLLITIITWVALSLLTDELSVKLLSQLIRAEVEQPEC